MSFDFQKYGIPEDTFKNIITTLVNNQNDSYINNKYKTLIEKYNKSNVVKDSYSKEYNNFKNKLKKEYTDCWNVSLFNLSFSYKRSCNVLGFNGNWYLEKFLPFINFIELYVKYSLHICYIDLKELNIDTDKNISKEVFDNCCNKLYICNTNNIPTKFNINRFKYIKNPIESIIGNVSFKYNDDIIINILSNKEYLDKKYIDKEYNKILLHLLKNFSDETEFYSEMFTICIKKCKEHIKNNTFVSLFLPEDNPNFLYSVMDDSFGNIIDVICVSEKYLYFIQKSQ